MNDQDWKNRCDSYKEIINGLEIKNLILREQNAELKDLLIAIRDQSESLSLKFKINEVLK